MPTAAQAVSQNSGPVRSQRSATTANAAPTIVAGSTPRPKASSDDDEGPCDYSRLAVTSAITWIELGSRMAALELARQDWFERTPSTDPRAIQV